MEEGMVPSMGFWQTLPGSNLSRVIARCGVDWIVVDCEHGNIDGKFIRITYVSFTGPSLYESVLKIASQ